MSLSDQNTDPTCQRHSLRAKALYVVIYFMFMHLSEHFY